MAKDDTLLPEGLLEAIFAKEMTGDLAHISVLERRVSAIFAEEMARELAQLIVLEQRVSERIRQGLPDVKRTPVDIRRRSPRVQEEESARLTEKYDWTVRAIDDVWTFYDLSIAPPICQFCGAALDPKVEGNTEFHKSCKPIYDGDGPPNLDEKRKKEGWST